MWTWRCCKTRRRTLDQPTRRRTTLDPSQIHCWQRYMVIIELRAWRAKLCAPPEDSLPILDLSSCKSSAALCKTLSIMAIRLCLTLWIAFAKNGWLIYAGSISASWWYIPYVCGRLSVSTMCFGASERSVLHLLEWRCAIPSSDGLHVWLWGDDKWPWYVHC